MVPPGSIRPDDFLSAVFIAVCSARCFRAGQEGTISIFIGGGHGNQIIFLVHDSRLSIRVHQIFRRESGRTPHPPATASP